jgi:hypothetical protein
MARPREHTGGPHEPERAAAEEGLAIPPGHAAGQRDRRAGDRLCPARHPLRRHPGTDRIPLGPGRMIVARILGGALLALGVAGMLTRGESPERGLVLAFIVYDTSTTVVLAWAGAAGTADGWLLWPVVGLHAILAAALAVGRGLVPGTGRTRSS